MNRPDIPLSQQYPSLTFYRLHYVRRKSITPPNFLKPLLKLGCEAALTECSLPMRLPKFELGFVRLKKDAKVCG
jgi:hypothetical protein